MKRRIIYTETRISQPFVIPRLADLRLRQHIDVLIIAILGIAVGVWYAWYVNPVKWTDIRPDNLEPAYQAVYIRAVSENFSFTQDTGMVQQALGGWNGAEAACRMAAFTPDEGERERLKAIALVMGGQCVLMAGGDGKDGFAREGEE